MYRIEHVDIGPANYSYAWVALVKEHCTAIALRVFIPMPQGGSRKGRSCGAWFSELAKKELASESTLMSRPPRKLVQQRPELVNRYIRIAVHRWMMHKAQALARRLSRPRLQWSERRRKAALASALETLAVEAARARRLGFEANSVVLNLGLFFLIAERDI